ncbi:hypothetical protein Rhsp01_58290 [Rhizobium sp. NBRC 114257]|nr:hypothetical protein Rhsp01_58290 [Rhizobium sp. NBRC 114257]
MQPRFAVSQSLHQDSFVGYDDVRDRYSWNLSRSDRVEMNLFELHRIRARNAAEHSSLLMAVKAIRPMVSATPALEYCQTSTRVNCASFY